MSIKNLFNDIKNGLNIITLSNSKMYLLNLINSIELKINDRVYDKNQINDLRKKIIYLDDKLLDSEGWSLVYKYCTINLSDNNKENKDIVKMYNYKFSNYKNYGNFKKFNFITKRMYNSKLRISKIKNELLSKKNTRSNKLNDWDIL
jgi:hypothetical protein